MEIKKIWILASAVILATMVLFSGCKPDEETKTKLADHETKVAENSKKIAALENDLKKANFELSQLKDVVTKIGDVTVQLQRNEEAKGRKAAPKSAVKTKPSAHPVAKKPAPKKHH